MSLSKFSVLSVFSNMLYSKKRKPGKAGNQQTALQSRKYPWIDSICNYEKTAKKQTIWHNNPIFTSKMSRTTFEGLFCIFMANFEQFLHSRVKFL